MEKIVFIGSVEISFHALDELINREVLPILVVTLRQDLAHRHSDYYDLSELATANNIPVLHVNNINEPDSVIHIKKLFPDYIFIIGWSQLVGSELLSLPRRSCIGFHFAKLPRNRGRGAIPWVILNQETETAVTLMHLDEGMDSGDIVIQHDIPIASDETSQQLYEKVCAGLREMMVAIAGWLKSGKQLPATPQDHAQATYLAKRTADDGWIDWLKPANQIERLIRAAGKPYPGAFTVYKDQKLVIWEAHHRPDHNVMGTIGQILGRNSNSVIVQCGEGWLDIQLVEDETTGGPVQALSYFSNSQDKLGIDMLALWKKLQTSTKG